MAKSYNGSVLGLSLVLLFSIFLFLQMAQTESRQLFDNGSANAKAAKLSCTNFIGHKEGETCFSITQQFNLTMDEFLSINPNLNCNKLFVGQWLCVEADFVIGN